MGYMDDQLKKVPADSTLYHVYATDAPVELGGKEQYIGELKLDGILNTSKFGDQQFYVRHQDMKTDVALKPEWEQYTDKFSLLQNLKSKCPFLS